ncbi:MAG: squalene/phytoene synthase family protein [Sphingomonas sp.]|nr:squalene/phytoene synthase family protein [Sphingomonas sp.]
MNDLPALADKERGVAATYAPPPSRAALTALWALDETLAGIVRAARQPMIGQMRLTWWHVALMRLGDPDLAGQPILAALAATVVPLGVSGASLAALIDGWEVLLDDGLLDDAALLAHAEARGVGLFEAAAVALGATDAGPVAAAGRGWALIDLGVHLRDADARRRCFALAMPVLAAIEGARWGVPGRPLGMLARLALVDVRAGPDAPRRQGSPSRLLRMARHRITGR